MQPNFILRRRQRRHRCIQKKKKKIQMMQKEEWLHAKQFYGMKIKEKETQGQKRNK